MAFNFPDGASSGDTHTASNGTVYRYNGTTWLVDSATTTSTFDSRYLNTGGDGIVSGSSQVTDGSTILSGSITSQLPSGVISGSTQITSTDLDMGGNKVLFANVYSTLGDLPNASTYHGMFAHVHAEGKGYFAHGGNWIPLANGDANLVSGSSQLDGFVSSSSTNIIEVMTSASYAGITPVSGTLYIIQG